MLYQTHRLTNKQSTVTLAAHARRGLITTSMTWSDTYGMRLSNNVQGVTPVQSDTSSKAPLDQTNHKECPLTLDLLVAE